MKIWAGVSCVAVALLAGCSMLPSVSDRAMRMRGWDTTCRLVFEGVKSGDYAMVAPLVVSGADLSKVFPPPLAESLSRITGRTEERFKKIVAEWKDRQKARWVGMGEGVGMVEEDEPHRVRKGERQNTVDMLALDNVTFRVEVDGVEKRIKINEMLRCGDTWKVFGLDDFLSLLDAPSEGKAAPAGK